MAHTLSGKKRVRASLKKNVQNKPIRTQSRTYVNKAHKSIDAGDFGPAEEAVKQAMRILDKTATKGVIHPNNAARHKSRLMKKLKKAQAASLPAKDG
ncbi:MAG: 30S ribosomal protein S20 [Dehalococcoidia bacterium]